MISPQCGKLVGNSPHGGSEREYLSTMRLQTTVADRQALSVERATERVFDLSAGRIRSKRRKGRTSEARHCLWFILNRCGWSKRRLSIHYGCDRSSVAYGIARVEECPELRDVSRRIIQEHNLSVKGLK